MAVPGSDGTIVGTPDVDIIFGGEPSSKIYGGDSTDLLFGGRGDDYIDGGRGNDLLFGGAGNDWLLGGAGSDFLYGGSGADQFRINGHDLAGKSVDIVADLCFSAGDKLVLYGFGAGTFDDSDGITETNDGRNDLDITVPYPVNPARYGEGAVIDSAADLAELVKFSDAVTASQGWCNTLVLNIDNGGGNIQVIKLAGLWNDYSSALADLGL